MIRFSIQPLIFIISKEKWSNHMTKKNIGIHIGIISFLTVLITLCLVTFALLTLSNAQANEKNTAKSIEHNEICSALSSNGEKQLKKIDDELYQIYQNSVSSQEYFQKIAILLDKIPESTLNNHIFSYDLKQEDIQLHVEIEILYPGQRFYRIITWKISPDNDWHMDQGLNLL